MTRPTYRRKEPRRRRPRLEWLELRQLLAVDGLTLASDTRDVEQNSSAITIDVLENDSFDEDYAGERRITAVSTGSLGGRIEIDDEGGALRYTPPADSDGTETFRYTVDGIQSADVRVRIVSPLPEFKETIYLFRDEYQFDLLAGARFSDDYTGDRRITLISESVQGADLQITEDGQSVIYQSRIGAQGRDQFTYIVDDLYVGSAIFDAVYPLVRDRYEVIQNSERTALDVLNNDFDGNADPGINLQEMRAGARITHVLSDSENFEIAIAEDGRSIDFTPALDYSGYATFRYVVDSRFEQTVQVVVQRPVREDYVSADVDGGVHTLDVLGNDVYNSIFGQRDIRVVDRVTEVTQGDQGGTVAISSDGAHVLYTPAVEFIGSETFDYVADEKHRATVTVSVTQPVRDDWQVVYVGTSNPINVLANDFAADAGAEATITSLSESEIGATIGFDSSGNIIYSPPEDALTRELPVYTDRFEYTVNESYAATVRVNLSPITSADHYEFDRPISRTLDVLRNDHFGEHYSGPGRITQVSTPSDGGSLSIAAGGVSLVYQPGTARESFTYTVDDRFTETVQIYPIRRLEPDRAVADQNGPAITIDVLANDFPAHDYVIREYGHYLGARELSAVSQSEQGGAVSINVEGKVSYVPPADFVGKDSFSYTVDGFLMEEVRVDVVRRAADDRVRVAPDSESNTLNVLANDILGADYTEPGLITDVTTSIAGAQVSIADDRRSIIYTSPSGFQGEDSFVYTIDGQSEATVTVSVHDDTSQLLTQFESSQQLRDYLLERSVERYANQFGQPGAQFDYLIQANERALASVEGAPEFSETNVQVAGVDEDDIVETDGNFIYALRGDELTIVRSLPADKLELISQTQIEGVPIGMYLNGDRVTVISQLVEYGPPEIRNDLVFVDFADDVILPSPSPSKVTTIVTVLDVADRSAPSVVQRTTVDSGFSDSRRIGDQVFLVLGSQDLLLEPELICDEDELNCVYETEQAFTDRVLSDFESLIERKLPDYESFDSGGKLVRGGPLVLPEDIFQSPDDATAMTIVVSINMASNEPGLAATSAVLAESDGDIYATAESLYVFDSHREAVENEPWTRILKFDWDGLSGAIDFAATGDVSGALLDQFSADEYNGLLRVTTEISNTETGNFSRQNETGLFILQDDQGVLEFVGQLQTLALGQDVKSVRYFGDSAMVTTFPTQGQLVDPLYAIDLSNPVAPRVLGHVPIPGFSSYMQFIGPDRLLTVGTNTATSLNGSHRGGRAMVSLFDVSDLTSPRLIDQYNLPKYSTSEANFDHHAFGWFARHELLAVPISRYFQDRFDDDGDGYAEAIRTVREDALSMLHIGVDESTGVEGITLRGEIDHTASVLRSVYVNNNVYSVGLDAIRTVSVDDPGTIVDEVVFTDDVQPTPIDARARFDFAELGTAARQMLADHANVEASSVMVVAREARGGTREVVLRSGENQYRYRGADGEDLVLVEEGFKFVDKWHNESNPNDVNGDGEVTASDALKVINEVGRREGSELPVDRVLRQIDAIVRFADTNGDGYVTSGDALRVINQMGRDLELRLSVEGEDPPPVLPAANYTLAIDAILGDDERDEPRLLF